MPKINRYNKILVLLVAIIFFANNHNLGNLYCVMFISQDLIFKRIKFLDFKYLLKEMCSFLEKTL